MEQWRSVMEGQGTLIPPQTMIEGENKPSNNPAPPSNSEAIEKLGVVIFNFDIGSFTILSC